MPASTNILLIRHAEEPDDEAAPTLSVAGQARAEANRIFFQNYTVDGALIRLKHIFAAADSEKSRRPRLTIAPLADALRLKPNVAYDDDQVAELAAEILADSKYDGSNILICWRHGTLPQLARALGATAGVVPDPWPEAVFGWLVLMSFDANGSPTTTSVASQKLMYGDFAQDPPVSTSSLPPAAG